LTSINQSVGADFACTRRTKRREKWMAGAAGRRGGGARSSMTQGAKIKEIVWFGGRETASWASGKGLEG
jgi:hypothetical protein